MSSLPPKAALTSLATQTLKWMNYSIVPGQKRHWTKSARQQIYAEMSRVLSEEQPVDFLIFHRANVGFQKNVMGIEPG